MKNVNKRETPVLVLGTVVDKMLNSFFMYRFSLIF